MEKRIVLVGIGHVFDISHQIENVINIISPDVVALELDKNRLSFLLSPTAKKGKTPLYYKILAKVQERLAKKYGVSTGSEMLAAARKARDNNLGILCIDKDARCVFDTLWKSIPLKRKLLLLLGGISSIFVSKKRVENELQSFEEEPISYFEQIEKHFPEFKNIIIDDRNKFMYNNLLKSLDVYNKIVAFVGEGHVPGLQHLLENHLEISVDIIHLKDLRENALMTSSKNNPI